MAFPSMIFAVTQSPYRARLACHVRPVVSPGSVPEVAVSGEDHGHTVLLGGGDDLFVSNGPTRLDHRGDPRLAGTVKAVAEREEGVRGQDGPAGPLSRGPGRDVHRGHAVHLSGPDPHRGQPRR